MNPVWLLLDRNQAISYEESKWFSSLIPKAFRKNGSLFCVIPDTQTREAFDEASKEFWTQVESKGEVTFVICGKASRVLHPDFIASPWTTYKISYKGKTYDAVSFPSTYMMLPARDGSSFFSALDFQNKFLDLGKGEDSILILEDVDKVMRIDNTGFIPKFELKILKSKEVKDLLFSLGPRVGIDLETSGLSFFRDKIICASVSDNLEKIYVFPWDDISAAAVKEWIVSGTTKEWVGAHLKFDAQFLARHLWPDDPKTAVKELSKFKWNDIILKYVSIDNSRVREKGLKALAPRLLNSIDYQYLLPDFQKLTSTNNISKLHKFFTEIECDLPLDEDGLKILRYNATDVYFSLILWDQFKGTQQEQEIFNLFMESPAKLLMKIAVLGLNLDWEAIKSSEVKIKKELEKVKARLKELAGIENPSSTKEVSAFVLSKLSDEQKKHLKKTKTGKASMDFASLEALNGQLKDEALECLVTFRSLRHLASNFVSVAAWEDWSDPKEKLLRPEFNQTSVTTGRLSGSKPNLQQLPGKRADIKSKKIHSETYKSAWNVRRFLVAPPRETLVEVDLNQADVRGAAIFTQESKMLKALREGTDLYKMLGEVVYNKPSNAITSEERVPLKTLLLGLLYGMQAGRIMKLFNISYSEAQAIYDKTFAFFPRLKLMRDRVNEIILSKDPVLRAPTRQRSIPEALGWEADQFYFRKEIMPDAMTSAMNFPIQSMVSDIILRIGLYLDEKLEGIGRIYNLVHDSVLFSIQTDKVDEFLKYLEKIRTIMIEDTPLFKLALSRLIDYFPSEDGLYDLLYLEYDLKVGTNWGDMKDLPQERKLLSLPAKFKRVDRVFPVEKSAEDIRLETNRGIYMGVKKTCVCIPVQIYDQVQNKAWVGIDNGNLFIEEINE